MMSNNLHPLSNLNRLFSRLIFWSFYFFMFSILIPSLSDALPMDYKDQKEELDTLNDIYVDEEFFSSEFWSVLNNLEKALLSGSYNYVLDTIKRMEEDQKMRLEIKAIEISALIGKQEFDAAGIELDKLVNSGQVPIRSLSIIAHQYLRVNKAIEAMRVCQDGLKLDARSSSLLYEMGYAYNVIGRPKVAIEYFKAANQTNKGIAGIKKSALKDALAATYMKLKDYEKIKAIYNNTVAISNSTLTRLIAQSKYMAANGKFDKALNFINLSIQRKNVSGLFLLKTQFLIMAGKFQEALSLISDLEDDYSVDSFRDKIILLKILTYLLMDSPKKALDLVDTIKAPEKISNFLLVKTTINVSLGRDKEAIDLLKKSAPPFSEIAKHADIKKHLKPISLGPKYALAYLYFDQGYYLQAINIIKNTLEESPNNFFLHYILAESLYRHGDYRQAVLEFTKTAKIFPQSLALKFRLANALEKAGAEKEALSAYSAITQDRPDLIIVILAHSKMLARLSRWSDARRVLESGLNFASDSAHLISSYGWALCYEKSFKDLDNLMPILKKNADISPAALQHLQGWAAYQQNDFINAQELLNQALYQAPGVPEICFHLGMTEYKNGNQKKAENLLIQSFYFDEQKRKYEHKIDSVLKKIISSN